MIIRPSWRMREEGEMLAFVGKCPECNSPASGVISRDFLRDPISELPELFCPKCRKRFRAAKDGIEVLPVNAKPCF